MPISLASSANYSHEAVLTELQCQLRDRDVAHTVLADYTDIDIMIILAKVSKTAAGSDGIPYWLYSECASELSHILSKLINFSINEGAVPQAWKQAVITPVPKTTPVSSVKDLRPISVTPVISRIVERLVVRDYLVPYVPREKLIDQYAYKATGNTTCAIINITDTVGRMLETNRYVRCLLLDFSKAFDTVDHLALLQKLRSYHLPGNVVSWIVSFLTDRTQCTKIDGILSELEYINRSIVQGSAIGPMSFSIYVADLKPKGTTNVICKYADDTTLLVPEMCDITIQDELENVLAWSSVNKLQLNLTKTKEIVFRRASVNFDVLPQQLSNVERLECVRLLGIHVVLNHLFRNKLIVYCLYVIKDCIC